MKAQLRLIDDNQARKFHLPLQEQRDEAYGPQGAVRELVGSENLIGLLVPPVEDDLPAVRAARHEVEVVEERRDEADRADDTVVDLTLIVVLQAIEKRSQIPPIRHEPAVILDIRVLPHPSGGRRIVEVVNPTSME